MDGAFSEPSIGGARVSALPRMSRMMRILLIALALLGHGCSGSDRNVILGTPPFIWIYVPYEDGRSRAVIETVRSFAVEHQMRFMLGGQTDDPDDFNVSAVTESLNLRAMHVGPIDDRTLKVGATARGGSPTPAQQALAQEFLRRVRAAGVASVTMLSRVHSQEVSEGGRSATSDPHEAMGQ